MASPNMATITASLGNFSLNNHHQSGSSTSSNDGGFLPENPPENSSERILELNSEEGALPYHWEQCLDLETGEIYYINWKTGMRSEEDPRTSAVYNGDYYSEDDESSGGSYDDESEESETSPCCSRGQWSGNSNDNNQGQGDGHYEAESGNSNSNNDSNNSSSVLVVAGCKMCFMYYMVPKNNPVCPKCCGGQLVHFDGSA